MKKLLGILANNIRAVRSKQGLSQRVLSERSGLDRTYIGKIERGERVPSLETIYKIAKTIQIEPFELLIPSEPSQDEKKFHRISRRYQHIQNLTHRYFDIVQNTIQRYNQVPAQEHPIEVIEKLDNIVFFLSEMYGIISRCEERKTSKFSEFVHEIEGSFKGIIDQSAQGIDFEVDVTSEVVLEGGDCALCLIVINEVILDVFDRCLHCHDSRNLENGRVGLQSEVDERTGRISLSIQVTGIPEVQGRPASESGLDRLNIREIVTNDLRGSCSIESGSSDYKITISFDRR